MKDSRALPSKGGLIGIILTGLAAIAFGVAVWLAWASATAVDIQQTVISPDATPDQTPDLIAVPTGVNLGTFGLILLSVALLVVVLYLAYQTRRFYALRYSLDRNAITINLGDSKQVIPLANIRHLVPATNVINQMREKVYGPQAKNQPATGPQAKSYPRQRPVEAVAETETPVQPENLAETRVEVQAEPLPNLKPVDYSEVETEADEEDFPSYQLTSTAAADSSLDHLESLQFDRQNQEVETAHFTEIKDDDGRDEFDPAQVRALAVDFDEQQEQRRQESRRAAQEAQPETVTAEAVSSSVNFQVSRRPLSSWPGFYLNRSNVNSLGPVQFYSTRPLEETLLIQTDRQMYAISPHDAQQFAREFNLRRRLGAIEPVEEGVIPGPFLSHPLWHDRLGRGLLAVGVVLNVLLYLFLIIRYNDLQPSLRMHFDKFGQVDRIGDRSELLTLPFLGLVALVGNSVLGAFIQPRDRIPAYLLYGAAILLQILTAVAVVVILLVS